MKSALLGAPIPASGAAKWSLALSIAALAAAVWGIEHRAAFHPALSFFPDTFDYAQMGRQVQRGAGFTSLQTFPYVLDFLIDHGVSTDPPWPNVTRFPLIAVLEAISFSVVGANDFGIVLVGGVFLVATAVVVFLLGNRLFGPLAGVVAALLACCNPTQLRYSLSGLLEPGAAFFLVAATLSLSVVESDTRRRLGPPVILGIILGLAFLQRYDLIVLAPAAGLPLLIGPRRREPAALVLCGLGFLAVAGPWFARNLVLFGSLLGSTSVDRNILGHVVEGDVYETFDRLDTATLLLQNYPAVLGKLLAGPSWILEHASELLGRGAAWSGPFFFACVVLASAPAVRSAWLFALGAFLFRMILLSLMHHEVRFYTSYAPLVMMFAVGGVAAGLRMLPSRAHAIIPLLAIVVLATTLAPTWERLGQAGPRLRSNLSLFDFVREHTAPGTVVLASPSARIAWYSDRPAIRFSSMKVLEELESRSVPIGALLLRSGTSSAARRSLEEGNPVGFRALGESGNFVLWVRDQDTPAPRAAGSRS